MTPRTAEEWGRVAVGLEGFTWKPGMLDMSDVRHVKIGANIRSIGPYGLPGLPRAGHMWPLEGDWIQVPNPDDPATAGCLLELLGAFSLTWLGVWRVDLTSGERGSGKTIGRACIAAAEKLGRWPGGEQ